MSRIVEQRNKTTPKRIYLIFPIDYRFLPITLTSQYPMIMSKIIYKYICQIK